MLIRRLFSSAFIANSRFFCFSTTFTHYDPLNSKFLSTSNLNEFLDLAEQSKHDISGETLGIVSKHLITLLNEKDDRYNFTKLGNFLASIKAGRPSDFSEKTLLSVLSLLRTLKNKNIKFTFMNDFTKDVASTYSSMVRNVKEVSDANLNNFINGYFQLASLNEVQNCRVVSFKILEHLQASTNEQLPLKNSQVSFLLHSLSLRVDLSKDQRNLRRILLKRVQVIMETVKTRDLVKLAASIARFEQYDMSLEEMNIARNVANKLVDNISDLEETNLYDLLRGQNNLRLGAFAKLYQAINTNIFQLIQPNGQTEFDDDSLMKIISLMASKVPLKQLLPEQQQKIFAFIKRLTKHEADRNFSYKLMDMIVHDFFVDQHKTTLVNILKENKVRPSLNLLYQLAIRKYNISPFEKAALQEINSEYAETQICKLGIIVHKLASNSEKAAEAYQKIVNSLTKQVSGPFEFLKLSYKLTRQEIAYPDFHDAFSKVIEQLPNPFASPPSEELPKNYRSFYLNYFFRSSKTYKQFFSFLEANKDSITDIDLCNLVWTYLNTANKGKKIEIHRSSFIIMNKIYPKAIQNKDRKGIETTIQLLDRYHRLVIGDRVDTYLQQEIFSILQTLISNFPLLQELNCHMRFIHTLEKYLSKNYKRYNLEHNYRGLIKHLLDHIHFFAGMQLHLIALKEGLRLNLVTKEVLEKVKEEDLNRLYFNQSNRLLYIKDPSFTPAIEKINNGSIQLILSNSNLQSVLVSNEQQIIQVIKKMHPVEVCNMVALFNHSLKTAACRRVLKQLISNLSRVRSLQHINFMGMLQNIFDHSYYIVNIKDIFERVVNELKNNIPKHSFQTHYDFIKLLMSQPLLNSREYYNKLLDFVKSDNRLGQWHYYHLLIRLASTNYIFKEEQLKQLPMIMEKNFYASLYFFLMVEPSLNAFECSDFVSNFVEKYNKLPDIKKNQQNFNYFHLLYLKKKYPTETKTLNLQGQKKYYEKFAIQHNSTELVKNIIELAGGKHEILKEFGDHNYLLRIKNSVIIFLAFRKMGNYHEHQFIKRAIPLILEEPVNVICINPRSSHLSIIQYINTSSPHLFDEKLYKKYVEENKVEFDRAKKEIAQRGSPREKMEVEEEEHM